MGKAVYYEIKNGEVLRLLQSNRAKLSTFISNEGKISFMTNLSFFSDEGYVVGRNQGDEKDERPPQTNFCGFHIVIFKDMSYKIGNFESDLYSVENGVIAGFSPCALFRNGKFEINAPLADKWTPNARINRTAVAYNGHWILSACQNMTAQEYNEDFWNKFKPHFVAFMDSGKSTEAIEKGKFVIPASQGEQTMFNGLASIELNEPEPSDKQKAKFVTKSTWVSQPMNFQPSHVGIKAIDFGTWKDDSLRRLNLPLNYDYPITAPFDCRVVYVDSQAKGGGTALESIDKVEYSNGVVDYCSVWIGHSNDTPKLNSTFKQGELVCHFGKAGAEVKHLHLEVIRGKFSEIYKNKPIAVVKQSVGNVYKLESTIEPNKALYLSQSDYIEDNPYQWKILKESSEIEELKKENKELKETIETKNKALKDIGEIVNGNL